ncbi:MAG: enoyl-CoA hydratase [Mycobacteriales bacterium]|jgi:enoyl-CoA hydratase
MGSLVTYRLDGPIATITMDDGKVNALSPAMLTALGAAFDRAEADGAVVVLAGRDGVFSAGFDLAVLGAGGSEVEAMVRGGFELAGRLLAFPLPVVVACTGHAVAMGVFLLLSADYRIGADGPYRITTNEVAIGLTLPRVAVEIMRQRLAPAHFNRAALLAEVYPPADAVTAGFLDRVVEPAALAAAAHDAGTRLAQLNMGAHAATKLRVRAPALAAVRAGLHADERALQAPPAASCLHADERIL